MKNNLPTETKLSYLAAFALISFFIYVNYNEVNTNNQPISIIDFIFLFNIFAVIIAVIIFKINNTIKIFKNSDITTIVRKRLKGLFNGLLFIFMTLRSLIIWIKIWLKTNSLFLSTYIPITLFMVEILIIDLYVKSNFKISQILKTKKLE